MTLNCQCGALTGRRCDWHGDASETVEVDYVPEYQRGTAEAAGTHVGLTERVRVCADCADWITHIPTKDGDVSAEPNPWAYLVEVRTLEIGVIVRANILAGELENGEPAGLSPHYSIRGVGLVPMRDGYQCWGAEVTGYDPAPQPGCSCAVCEVRS